MSRPFSQRSPGIIHIDPTRYAGTLIPELTPSSLGRQDAFDPSMQMSGEPQANSTTTGAFGGMIEQFAGPPGTSACHTFCLTPGWPVTEIEQNFDYYFKRFLKDVGRSAQGAGETLKLLFWDNIGSVMYDVTGWEAYKQQSLNARRAAVAQRKFIMAGPDAAMRNLAKGMLAPLDRFWQALANSDTRGALEAMADFMATVPFAFVGPEGTAMTPPLQLAAEGVPISITAEVALSGPGRLGPGYTLMASANQTKTGSPSTAESGSAGTSTPQANMADVPATEAEMVKAVEEVMHYAQSMAMAEGMLKTCGRLGTRAHEYLELLLELLDGQRKDLNQTLRSFRTQSGDQFGVLSEAYFDASHNVVSRRAKGSLATDALLFKNGSPFLGMDLKTGRPWSLRKLREIESRLGVRQLQVGL